MERKIVDEFKNEPEGHKDRLLQNHRIRGLLDAMQVRRGWARSAGADPAFVPHRHGGHFI